MALATSSLDAAVELPSSTTRTEAIRNWIRPPNCERSNDELRERRSLRALFGIDERSEGP